MKALQEKPYDVVVIGGGHNGLVHACLLRKAGKRVLVIERREFLGGATVTRPFKNHPEASNTTYSYLLSMFPKKLVEILRLAEAGLVLAERNPNSATPTLDGRVLERFADDERSDASIAQFSKDDVKGHRELMDVLGRLAKFIEYVMEMDPPDPFSFADLPKMYGIYRKARQLSQDDTGALMKLMFSSAYDFVTDYITSEPLVGAITSDGIIGADGGPKTPGTGAVLVHHDMGDLAPDGRIGVWYQTWNDRTKKGGMGGFTDALEIRALEWGVEFLLGVGVKRILSKMKRGKPVFEAVELEDGRIIRARACVSTVDAWQTYSRVDPDHLPDGHMRKVEGIDTKSYAFKINVLVKKNGKDRLRWACGMETPPGTIHLLRNTEYVQRAYEEGRQGVIPEKMMLEVTVPTVQDPYLAPTGKYDVISMFCQYAALELEEGPWNDERKGRLRENAFAEMRPYCNIDDVFVDAEVHTAFDMQRDLGLTGGNIFQGGLGLWQMFFARHLFGWNFKTPVSGLFIGGSAAPPGGGVTGRPAELVLRHVLKYLRRWF